MRTQTSSILIGAAVAAMLILPARAADWTWVKGQTQGFPAHSVDLEGVTADVTVRPLPGQGNVTMSVSGPRVLVDDIKSKTGSDVLTVWNPRGGNDYGVWDWSKWFDYSHVDDENKVKIELTMPQGSALTAKHMVGDLTVGDLDGKVFLETSSGDVKVGRVSQATVKAVGSGGIEIGAVGGVLDLSVAGSGDIKVASALGAKVSIAGSGDAELGAINGPLHADLAGSGDLTVQYVNGPVVLSVAGAGDTNIKSGHANPLKASIVGSGDLSFGGDAVDPSISAFGSGDVWIKSYTGKLSSSGMANVSIGDKKDKDDD
jgi:hypothetical protein